MRHRNPHMAGSAGTAGSSDPLECATQEGCGLRFELRGRLHAVLQELDMPAVDFDVVQTLLEGAVEAIEANS